MPNIGKFQILNPNLGASAYPYKKALILEQADRKEHILNGKTNNQINPLTRLLDKYINQGGY